MSTPTISTSETKLEALKLQSSAYGVTVPVLGGVNRIPGNLLDYMDFKATPNTSTQSAGGKGGGVKTENTTFTYSASVLMAICHGVIGAISRIWKGKQVYSGGWSPALVNGATETYTPPGSGAMTYTLAHGSTLIGEPTIKGPFGFWVVQLAAGTDYTLAGSVITVLRDRWRGVALTVNYQWGTGAPDLSPLTALGLTLATGDMGQAAASWLTSAHPDRALNYPGLAYVHAQDYNLGGDASVDNHSFEVQGSGAYRYGAALPDCNPAEFTAGLLTNGRYGARMPAETVEVQTWLDYCAAAGLLMSPLLTEQVRAADYIDQICKFTNAAPVWSYDRLRIVPYGDAALTANGVTYTPNTTPLFDLDDDHWLQAGTDDPLAWNQKEPSERFNHVRVEFNDRANYYNKNIAEAKDDADIAANGLRSMAVVSAPWICDAAVARLVAEILKQRSLNITGTGTVKLPWAYCLLECMDLVTITDAALGFLKKPVRITAIGEDENGDLEVEVEDWPLGTASPTMYPSQVAGGYQHDYNVAPGSVEAPTVVEAPGALTVNGLELLIATTGLGAMWGGCRVWVSLDGTNYKQVATLNGGSRYGTLDGAAGSSGALAVLLKKGTMLSGTAADASALNTLCWVGGASPEFFAYETATLTSALHYTLGGGGIVRGAYGSAAAAHASGVPFVRIDDAVARSGPIDLGYIGRTIHLKFTSFNIYGGGEEQLASVTDYTYAITGAQQYGNAGALAVATLSSIASDNVLTPDEKPRVILDRDVIVAEQSGIDTQAASYQVTTELTAYDTAVSDLVAYLATLTTPVAWDNLTGNTTIVGTTFRTKFADVYTARQALRNKMDANAKTAITLDSHDFGGTFGSAGSNQTQRSFTVTPGVSCTVDFTATLTAAFVLPDSGMQVYWTVTPAGGSALTLGACDSNSSSRQSFTCATSFAATGGVTLTFALKSSTPTSPPGLTYPLLYASSMRVMQHV